MLVFLVICVCSACLMCLLRSTHGKGKPQIGMIRHAFSTPFIVCVCVFSWNLSVCL